MTVLKFIDSYHERCNGRIERKILYILRHFLYDLVQGFELIFGRFGIFDHHPVASGI